MDWKLYLFGPPRVEHNGRAVELSLRKGLALLVYVTRTSRPHSRDALATLLWPDKDQRTARANLRRTLYELGEALGEQILEMTGDTVALQTKVPVWLDVDLFQACLRELPPAPAPVSDAAQLRRLEEAAALYTADFLAGFTLPDSPEFDDWQFFQREELRRGLATLLERLVLVYEAQGNWAEAARHAARWLSLDPLEEAVHRRLMQVYAQAGQPAAALRQYAECVRILAQELDAPPADETTALYTAIRTKRYPADARTSGRIAAEAGGARPSASLPPPPTTPFVGRRQELAELLRRVGDPNCRLLTLVGPGGIGKTRLVLEAAQTQLAHGRAPDPDAPAPGTADLHFRDGVFFVPLQPVNSPSGLVPAIAAALGLQFHGSEPPRQQLLDFLYEKQLLLVLDNFEHLLAGADLLPDILAAAPDVKLLVTSREALKLYEEWFHPLAGMQLPPSPHLHAQGDTDPAAADAVQLFVQTARRADHAFAPEPYQAEIARICRLVDGMPLAIELAASWLKVISCAQIAQEIETGMDILVARHHNVPARHRSMRAVLEHSWQLLDQEAHHALQRLAVFRGGFLADAAAALNIGLLSLAGLVDTAWIYITPDRRYQIHELLRQFAADRLAAAPGEQAKTQARHAAFYLDLVAARQAALIGPDQRAALDQIAAEIDNVEAAWETAIRRRAWPLIRIAHHALYLFFLMRGRYAEGQQWFAAGLRRLDETPPAAGEPDTALRLQLLARLGVFHLNQGDLETAERCFSAVLDAGADGRERAFVYTRVGELARLRSDRPAAEAALSQSLSLARAAGDDNQTAEALHILTDLAGSFADFAEGRRVAQEALAVCRKIQRPDLTARVLAALAWDTNCQGDYAESERYYREALAISESIGEPFGIALATQFLGWVAFCAGGARLAEALTLYAKALVILRRIGQRALTSMCLSDMALASGEQGDYPAALGYAQEGLAIAEEIKHPGRMSYNLATLGAAACGLQDLAAGRGHLLRALQIAHQTRLSANAALILHFFARLLVAESRHSAAEPAAQLAMQSLALELLAFVIQHPATWQPVRDRAQLVQADLLACLPVEVAAPALERGRQRTLDATVAEILGEASDPAAPKPPETPSPPA